MSRVLALALLLAFGCSGGNQESPAPHGSEPDAEVAEAGSEAEVEEPAAPDALAETERRATELGLSRIEVELYFPAGSGSGLVGESREIYKTTAPADRVKQIIAALISGPESRGALRVLPKSVALRQVYVVDGGDAWLDFSEDIGKSLPGGSQRELLTVYALVDSVALNVAEIERVGLLVGGHPIDTLQGHVDLRRPLRADRSWILR